MDPITRLENVGLELSQMQFDEMLLDVRQRGDEEACGLIGGIEGIALKVYRITNSLHSPTSFRMDPGEQVKALMEIELNGWDLLAIYHSHLRGPSFPSVTDTKEFAYPGVIYLIFNMSGEKQILNGFRLNDGIWNEIPITITD